MQTLKDAALHYGEMGWTVFPLSPKDKVPMSAELTYKNATSDSYTLAAWWDEFPDANIGLQPAKSGLVILDIDKKNGGLSSLAHLESLHGTLTTRRSLTGGGGYHYFFKHPGGDIRNQLNFSKLPGVDLLAATGHILLPPSVHPNGTSYRWDDVDAPIHSLPAWMLPAPATQRLATSPAPAIPGLKGKLSREAREFLASGAQAGTWNVTLFKAAKEAQQAGWTEEDFLEAATHIDGYLDAPSMKTIASAFRTPAKYEPRIDTKEALRALIKRCHLITDIADPGNTRLVDLSDGKVHAVHVNTIRAMLWKEEAQDYFNRNVLPARFTYNPHLNGAITLDESTGIQVYNNYEPPEWRAGHYFHGERLDLVTTLPEIYVQFFGHLTDGHQESQDYLLDWIAQSLRARNLTILTAIGEQGIGKGVLGEILERLHGRSNFVKVRDQVFKSQFNAPLKHKTLVYVDEADLRTKEAQDRVKDTVNDTIEIEEKGKDAVTIKNYASFYLSSNSYDAVRIEASDRRFSIIQLTNKPLRETPLIGRIPELVGSDNVKLLALYLMQRTISHDMLSPFRSARAEQVIEAGLSDWESYVVFEWAEENPGKSVPIKDLQDAIQDNCGLRSPPGRRKIEELEKKYPRVFHVRRVQHSAKRFIDVNPLTTLPASEVGRDGK